jgi:SAM-dependent methyltransferase
MSAQKTNGYLLDAESTAEMGRLTNQDAFVTEAMGGLFPADLDLSSLHRVLDVACGPGQWASEVAFAHQQIEVVGVDMSQTMIAYARAQARVQGLGNVQFQVMDATRPLAFPDATFDFVNARFLAGFLRTHQWPATVSELVRVCRPGGLIRLTECDTWGATNSVAIARLQALAARAFFLDGRSFHPLPDGHDGAITLMLPHFLRQAGCQDIVMQAHTLDFSAEAPAWSCQYENLKVALLLLQPFLLKAGVTTKEEVEPLYQQALAQMMRQDFRGVWTFLSVSGRKREAQDGVCGPDNEEGARCP